MDESWYKLFVLPFVENYEMILLSMSCCFVIQWGTHFLSKIFFPNSYGKLNPRDQLDWCIRAVAIAHAIASWGSIPGALYPSEEIAGKLDSVTGMMVYNHYAFSAESQFYFQIGTGYFLWDIIVSLYYNWGAVYITHGFASFGVFYFSLNPFLHLWGRFYHGVFELSTPWIHLREIMELGGYDGILKTICEGLFALSFTIVRIILGVYVSYWWWMEMVNLIITGQAHSNFVIVYYLIANSTLMALQIYWFVLLALAALGKDVSDKAKNE